MSGCENEKGRIPMSLGQLNMMIKFQNDLIHKIQWLEDRLAATEDRELGLMGELQTCVSLLGPTQLERMAHDHPATGYVSSLRMERNWKTEQKGIENE